MPARSPQLLLGRKALGEGSSGRGKGRGEGMSPLSPLSGMAAPAGPLGHSWGGGRETGVCQQLLPHA